LAFLGGDVPFVGTGELEEEEEIMLEAVSASPSNELVEVALVLLLGPKEAACSSMALWKNTRLCNGSTSRVRMSVKLFPSGKTMRSRYSVALACVLLLSGLAAYVWTAREVASVGTLLCSCPQCPVFPPSSPCPQPVSWLDVLRDNRTRVLDDAGQETELGVFPVTPDGRPVPVRRLAYGDGTRARVPEEPNAPGYSSLLVDTSGPNAVYARNVCWHRRGIYAWRPLGAPKLVPDRTRARMETVPGGFHPQFWGSLVERESDVPVAQTPEMAQTAVWHNETAIMLRPAYARHISHFTEAVVTPIHLLRHPATFPWASEATLVFMPLVVRGTELAWNLGFLELVLGFFPERPRLMFAEEAGVHTHCFERLVWVGSAGAWDWGNLFADPWDAQLLRRAAYAAHGVPEDNVTSGTPPRVLLVRRVTGNPGRHLLNAAEVEAHVRGSTARGVPLLFLDNAQSGALEKYSFAEQVRLVAQADVLVGVHGSGLNNALFMRPGSVIVDILPGRMLEMVWHNTAVSAGVRYYFLINERSSSTTNADCAARTCDAGLHYDNWGGGSCMCAFRVSARPRAHVASFFFFSGAFWAATCGQTWVTWTRCCASPAR